MEIIIRKALVTLFVDEEKETVRTYIGVSHKNKEGVKEYANIPLYCANDDTRDILEDNLHKGKKEGSYYGYFDIKGFFSCYISKVNEQKVITVVAMGIAPSHFEEKVVKKAPLKAKSLSSVKKWKFKETKLNN